MRDDERKVLRSIDESLGCLTWTVLGILLVLCTMCLRQ